MKNVVRRVSFQVFAAFAAICVAATAPLLAEQQSQSTMTVSVVVQPACIIRTAPAEAGRVSVELTCARRDVERVRVDQRQIPIARESGTARTTVLSSGSLVQVDF